MAPATVKRSWSSHEGTILLCMALGSFARTCICAGCVGVISESKWLLLSVRSTPSLTSESVERQSQPRIVRSLPRTRIFPNYWCYRGVEACVAVITPISSFVDYCTSCYELFLFTSLVHDLQDFILQITIVGLHLDWWILLLWYVFAIRQLAYCILYVLLVFILWMCWLSSSNCNTISYSQSANGPSSWLI